MYPASKPIFIDMLADLLSEGMVRNKHNSTATIFSLKNLCGWADKRETVSSIKKLDEIVDKNEAKECIMKYMKENNIKVS